MSDLAVYRVLVFLFMCVSVALICVMFSSCSKPVYMVKTCEYKANMNEWSCSEVVKTTSTYLPEPTAYKITCRKSGSTKWWCQSPKGVKIR